MVLLLQKTLKNQHILGIMPFYQDELNDIDGLESPQDYQDYLDRSTPVWTEWMVGNNQAGAIYGEALALSERGEAIFDLLDPQPTPTPTP